MDTTPGAAPLQPTLTLLPREMESPWELSEDGTALRELRRSRPEHTSQAAAAAMLGLRVRDYSGLESGRLTLSADDWQRVMEVIRG